LVSFIKGQTGFISKSIYFYKKNGEKIILYRTGKISKKNVTEKGEISLRLIDNDDKPLPIDYVHIIPNTPGYEIGSK
jgi:hypothetical protein